MQSIQTKDKIEQGKSVKIAPFREEIRKTAAHKHKNYFEIIYLSAGEGIHQIDYQDYPIQAPVIFFIRKEQVHCWEISSLPKGYVAILKSEFVQQSLDGELQKLISRAGEYSCVPLSSATAIEQLFALLVQEDNFTAIEGLLKALMSKILEEVPAESTGAATLQDTFQAFQELLSHTQQLKNNVAYYAERLHTSPQNLNRLCRKNTGQSASQMLALHIVQEAKRLLRYTDNSIAEIAFALDFSDASHFVKYFKRHTGQTPKAFRLS